MDKLSQKELLDEGFLSGLRKAVTKTAAGVGGAVAAASRAGTSAGIGDVVGGVKSGLEKEKQFFKSKDSELDKAIEELGYFKLGKERGKGDTVVVDVAELDYSPRDGKPKQGQVYSKPLIIKWDKESKSFSVVKSPKGVGEGKPDAQPDAQSETQPDAQSETQPDAQPEAKPAATPAAQAKPNLGPAFNKSEAKPTAKKVPPPSQSALQPKAKLGDAFNKPADKPVAKKVPPPSASALQPKAKLGDAFDKSASKPKSDIFATKSKPEAGARGKKGPRGEKSDTPEAAGKRIRRAIAAGRPASRGDVNILKKAGVKGSQTIGGVKLSNLTRRKLADSISQKNLMRQLTLLFK